MEEQQQRGSMVLSGLEMVGQVAGQVEASPPPLPRSRPLPRCCDPCSMRPQLVLLLSALLPVEARLSYLALRHEAYRAPGEPPTAAGTALSLACMPPSWRTPRLLLQRVPSCVAGCFAAPPSLPP
jgi:hypothetical protein